MWERKHLGPPFHPSARPSVGVGASSRPREISSSRGKGGEGCCFLFLPPPVDKVRSDGTEEGGRDSTAAAARLISSLLLLLMPRKGKATLIPSSLPSLALSLP